MNKDLVDCKRKARELVSSDNPPCNENGKRRGYIEIMKELWDGLRLYGHLQLKSQNLQDQAWRPEKVNNSGGDVSTAGMNYGVDIRDVTIHGNQNMRFQVEENENAYFSGRVSDLHITGTEQIAVVREKSTCNSLEVCNDAPGRLPEYMPIDMPPIVSWGMNNAAHDITVSVSVINDAYNEIISWRKNTLVPYGKTGRDFIDHLTKHVNDWNNGTKMQHIALKAAIVLLALALQKPGQKSKAKEHQQCLKKRLEQWKNGEIKCLMREGRAIQRGLQNAGTRYAK